LRDDLGGGRALTQAVNLLVQSGCLTSGRTGYQRTTGSTPEAVARAVDVAENAERVDLTRVEMIRSYAEGNHCRRQILLGYFGDRLPQRCDNCDVCWDDDGGDMRAVDPAIASDTVVEHRQWGRGIVLDGDSDRVVVLFDDYGYRTLDLGVVRANGLLETA
jgi:ATP-dependent DNA helicase RecQ